MAERGSILAVTDECTHKLSILPSVFTFSVKRPFLHTGRQFSGVEVLNCRLLPSLSQAASGRNGVGSTFWF